MKDLFTINDIVSFFVPKKSTELQRKSSKSKSNIISKSKSKVKSISKSEKDYKKIMSIKKLDSDYNANLLIIRRMVLLYYLSLFHKNNNFKKIYENDFYIQNIINHNIYIFTLANKIPVDFLPLPKHIYYMYPFITFYNHSNKDWYSYGEIKLTNNIHKDIYKNEDLFHFYKDTNNEYPTNEALKNVKNKLINIDTKNITQHKHFQIHIPLKYLDTYLSKHNESYKSKTILLYGKSVNDKENKYYILLNYKINTQNKCINIFTYYEKKSGTNTNYIKKNNKNKIYFNTIQYLSIMDNITKEKILKVYNNVTLKKNTVLFNQMWRNSTLGNIKNDELNYIQSLKYFYTLYPDYRIQNPLFYFKKHYVYQLFNVKENIELLNLSYTILNDNSLFNNKNKNKKYINKIYYLNNNKVVKTKLIENNIFKCSGLKYNHNINRVKKCNSNIITALEYDNYEPNYNKRLSLFELLYKNLYYCDTKNIKYHHFLENLDFNGIYNNMSYFMRKNKSLYPSGTEIYIFNYDYIKQKIEVLKDIKPIYRNNYLKDLKINEPLL